MTIYTNVYATVEVVNITGQLTSQEQNVLLKVLSKANTRLAANRFKKLLRSPFRCHCRYTQIVIIHCQDDHVYNSEGKRSKSDDCMIVWAGFFFVYRLKPCSSYGNDYLIINSNKIRYVFLLYSLCSRAILFNHFQKEL